MLPQRLQALGIKVYGDGLYYNASLATCVLTGKNFQGQIHPWLSAARQAVEHTFGLEKRLWPFLKDREMLKIFQSPVKHTLTAAALLTNAHSLLYANQVSKYFDATGKIELEAYFGAGTN